VLQALPYVCLLIAMLFFIYAIIGMQVRTITISFSVVQGGFYSDDSFISAKLTKTLTTR
jgi:hypothetical protein